MKTTVLTLFAPLLVAAPARGQYLLVWSDEFDGTQVDPAKWEAQIGNGCPALCGWGNNELQYYRAENATVTDGFLTITAREESFGGMDYTSARLRTRDLGDWKRGRFEMRARMPVGQGLWPAFWMLPTDEDYGGWAASGELDIVEYLGHDPDHVLGTIHYGGEFPENDISGGGYTLPVGTFHDDFHVFAVEWDLCEIRWSVDGVLYSTKRTWWSSGGPFPAPFDARFHLLLNVAVGGNLPGPPDSTTSFPQEMVVDWVRVYRVPGPDLDACTQLFAGMNHADPFGHAWFSFGGSEGGGGIGANLVDLPPVDGCHASLEAGFGGAAPGFYGGFGRWNPLDLGELTHFSLWIDPDPGQEYDIELNLQDDDDGDDWIPATPDGADDEFQYVIRVSPTGPDVIAGGGWQKVTIPLASFVDDNSYHWGGNGIFDPVPVDGGGNGQLVNVVIALFTDVAGSISFRTDDWTFTAPTSAVTGRVWDDADADGVPDGGEPGRNGVTVELVDPELANVVATDVTSGDGDWSFPGLLGGDLEVRVDTTTLPPGLVPTFDPDGTATPHVFALALGCAETAANRDFGYALEGTSAPLAGSDGGALGQNAPNPFRPRTVITFELSRPGPVKLEVLDVAGRRIASLVDGRREAGAHRVEWSGRTDDGTAASAGVYFYALRTEEGRWVRRMTLLK